MTRNQFYGLYFLYTPFMSAGESASRSKMALSSRGSTQGWPSTIAIVTALTQRAKENYIDSFKEKLAEAEDELKALVEITDKVRTKTKHVLQSMPATYVQQQKHSFAVSEGTDTVQGLGTDHKIPPYLRHDGPVHLKIL